MNRHMLKILLSLLSVSIIHAMEQKKTMLNFIEYQRKKGQPLVQVLGKYYRTQGFDNARFFFDPETPAGAIIAGVKEGTIQPQDVIVLFDVDGTLIADN